MITKRNIGEKRPLYVGAVERLIRQKWVKIDDKVKFNFSSPEALGVAFALEMNDVDSFGTNKAWVLLLYSFMRKDVHAFARYYCAHLLRCGVELPKPLLGFVVHNLEELETQLPSPKSRNYLRDLFLRSLLTRLEAEKLSRNLAEEIIIEAFDNVGKSIGEGALNHLRRKTNQLNLLTDQQTIDKFKSNARGILQALDELTPDEVAELFEMPKATKSTAKINKQPQ